MHHRKPFSWAKPGQHFLSSNGLENIDLSKSGEIITDITDITLIQLDDHNVEKLKHLVRTSPLQKLLLSDCFHKAETLKEILEALAENESITRLILKLRDNACDLECICEINKLLSRNVIRSLVLPQGLDEFLLAEVLQHIVEEKVELRELDISGSVINDDSLNHLKIIISSRLVKNKLIMTGCEGVANTTLTTKQKEMLEEAQKSSSRFSLIFTRLDILWFSHVEQASQLDGEIDGDYQVCEVEEVVRPIFHGKLGAYEKVIRFLVRNKKRGQWQHLRTVRKRGSNSDIHHLPNKRPNKEKRNDAEIDLLSDQLQAKSQNKGGVDSSKFSEQSFPIERNFKHPNEIPIFHYRPKEDENIEKLVDLSAGNSTRFGRASSIPDELRKEPRNEAQMLRRTSLTTLPSIRGRKKREIAGYAIYQKNTSIKLSLWTLPEGEETPFLDQLDAADYTFINASEFNLTDGYIPTVTVSIVTPYRKDLMPTEKVNLKQLTKKKYMEIDYTIPEIFKDANSVEISYTISEERGRFQLR